MELRRPLIFIHRSFLLNLKDRWLDIVNSLPDGEVIAVDSKHWIQREKPELVLEKIRLALRATQI